MRLNISIEEPLPKEKSDKDTENPGENITLRI
jgi:hypothetical protein